MRTFENIPSVLEVGCSGKALESSADIFMMTLFVSPGKDVIASVNLRKKKCITHDNFSSCRIDDNDSRKTEVRTLIMNMVVGEIRQFGCKLVFESGGWSESVSWFLDVRRNGKWIGWMQTAHETNTSTSAATTRVHVW